MLDQAVASCATEYGERIVTVMLSKTAVDKVGNQPTAAEFAVAFDEGMVVLYNVTSGSRTQLSEDEIEVVYKEWYDKQYRVEGKLRILSEELARACEKYAQPLYMYYITENNYCFGGWQTTPDFSLIVLDGKGNPIYIHFRLDFFPGIDYSLYDANYDNITGLVSITADSTIITVDSTLITSDRI